LAQNRLLATGIIGFIVMLGCVTPVLVALLAALGVPGSRGWLDYILLPAMMIFAAVAGYALVCRRRRQASTSANR
jgi:mercuric ion transport protein